MDFFDFYEQIIHSTILYVWAVEMRVIYGEKNGTLVRYCK